MMYNAKHWIVARHVWKVSLEQKALSSREKNGEVYPVSVQLRRDEEDMLSGGFVSVSSVAVKKRRELRLSSERSPDLHGLFI